MHKVRRLTCVTALTVAAMAMTGGVAGAVHAAGSAPSVSGEVTAVNGVSTFGTCGTADTDGNFTVTPNGITPTPHTVNVTSGPSGTAFVEKKVASPTFANVCVGDNASAIGTQSGFVLNASAVSIHVPNPAHNLGTVTSVGGLTASGSCGLADTSGDFTLSTVVAGIATPSTVFVTQSTTFKLVGVGASTFASVCVGDYADADGLTVGSSVLADSVKIRIPKPPAPLHVRGLVSSINGVSSGCGVANTDGTFVITWSTSSHVVMNTTVGVTSNTPFSGKTGTTSFAAVCVGAKSSVIGTYSSGELEAAAVATYPVKV